MGFFKKMLGGDPERDLERAETLLEAGEVGRGLELALRAEKRSPEPERYRYAAVVTRARRAFAAEMREKARRSADAGHLEDAIEWLDAALEEAADEDRGELETRRQELERALETREREARGVAARDRLEYVPETGSPDDTRPTQFDLETHFFALIDMLDDEVAARYEAAPKTFRPALMVFNEGDAKEAAERFDKLLAEHPDEPVIRLERGRARLAVGRAADACEDFEAVWPIFGDGPLDRARRLSVPSLWAMAMLARGKPRPVLERLEPLADPERGDPELAERYGEALLAAERFDDARAYAARAAARFPSEPAFAHQLAVALARLGERDAAIECLETAIAPSCASGSCARPPRHLPSLRTLAALHLEGGENPERAVALMALVVQDLRGELEPEDEALVARLRELGYS